MFHHQVIINRRKTFMDWDCTEKGTVDEEFYRATVDSEHAAVLVMEDKLTELEYDESIGGPFYATIRSGERTVWEHTLRVSREACAPGRRYSINDKGMVELPIKRKEW